MEELFFLFALPGRVCQSQCTKPKHILGLQQNANAPKYKKDLPCMQAPCKGGHLMGSQINSCTGHIHKQQSHATGGGREGREGRGMAKEHRLIATHDESQEEETRNASMQSVRIHTPKLSESESCKHIA
jgi:hypothetical protein